ncbi:MAG TPA: glutamine amidotransferase [Candidatus Saccharimonadales bacterium]|nr:glutamine amidotransferase [Candidatus Saccharimonadales bacterium]
MTKLHIVHIYPNEMNTYGDRGNLLTLVKRAEWRGLEPVVHYYHAGDDFPKEAGLVLGGGGQDSAQSVIQEDILRIGDQLHTLVEAGVPMLMVCGTYQLLGKRFLTQQGEEIKGIGVFNVETLGGPKRLIGNVAVDTTEFGTLYGFENHSGRTFLHGSQQPLGTITRGNGNNGEDRSEGARTKNTLGTYLHGPILPNNPRLADELLRLALRYEGAEMELRSLDDSLAIRSRENAVPRKY